MSFVFGVIKNVTLNPFGKMNLIILRPAAIAMGAADFP
jgi:hypothetical protein